MEIKWNVQVYIDVLMRDWEINPILEDQAGIETDNLNTSQTDTFMSIGFLLSWHIVNIYDTSSNIKPLSCVSIYAYPSCYHDYIY